MRIVHVFRAPLGGLFRHVLDLASGQAERGHHVGLFCDSRVGNSYTERLLAELEPKLSLGMARIDMARNPGPQDLKVLLAFRRHLRSLAPDVVHGHGSKGGLYARLSGPSLKADRVVRAYTPHGGSLNYNPGTLLHRVYMIAEGILERRTDFFPFESDFVRMMYERYVGVPRHAFVKVVHNGLHPSEFEPITHNADAADFVYVGEFRPVKGLTVFLEALKCIRDAQGEWPSVVFIGSGPDQEMLEQHISSNGLGDKFKVLAPRAIRQAFILGKTIVAPSLAESLPYVVLESAAAQQPIVTTRVGGIPEVFGPYADRLVEPGSVPDLTRALMANLHLSTEERDRQANELRLYVQAHFSVDGMVDAITDGYRKARESENQPYEIKRSVTLST